MQSTAPEAAFSSRATCLKVLDGFGRFSLYMKVGRYLTAPFMKIVNETAEFQRVIIA